MYVYRHRQIYHRHIKATGPCLETRMLVSIRILGRGNDNWVAVHQLTRVTIIGYGNLT